jgi:hypothetical protein
MKVYKSFLSKIIKEEIKRVLYEEEGLEKEINAQKRIHQMRLAAKDNPIDEIVRQLDNLFVQYRDELSNDPTKNQELVVNLQKILNKISPDLHGPEILQVLDGKIDRQLLSFISDLLKHDPRMQHGGYSLPDYEMPLELGREQGIMPYNKGQTDAFIRAPQHNGPYEDEEQIDDRKNQKNLVKENNKMKITKEYLKKLILEELNTVEEAEIAPLPKKTRPDPTVRPQAAPPTPLPPPGAEQKAVFVVVKQNRIFGVFADKATAQQYANKAGADVIPSKLI